MICQPKPLTWATDEGMLQMHGVQRLEILKATSQVV